MAISAYENLFESMKNEFTVVNDNCEYSIGNYLRMKYDEKYGKNGLPMTFIGKMPGAVCKLYHSVENTLSVTEMPSPEKTIKSFPLRTAFSALLTSFVVLTLGISLIIPGTIATKENYPAESFSQIAEETDTLDLELSFTKL